MKSLAGQWLDRGCRQAYEGWLLIRLCEVLNAVSQGGADTPCGLALQEGLDCIEKIDPQDLLRSGTPYFWLNLQRLQAALPGGVPAQAVRDLLMTAFDAYFTHLPVGTTFSITGAEQQSLILPRLGIAIPGVVEARLRRVSLQQVEVVADGSPYRIDPERAWHRWQLRSCKVFDAGPETVLAVRDPAVIESEFGDIFVEGDLQGFTGRVREALRWIQCADAELYASIRRLVHWYVPLNLLGPGMHPSYSEPGKIGVAHLSEAYTGIRLCESIVHEFHHNELFVLQATQDLTHRDRGAVFYSPWRSDPRTLDGLLHALHVFTAVVRFYGAADAARELDFDRREARRRRTELCLKLRLGLLQVPSEDLTALGLRFRQALAEEIRRQECELKIESASLSDAMRAHLGDWCRTNPASRPSLRLPEVMEEVI